MIKMLSENIFKICNLGIRSSEYTVNPGSGKSRGQDDPTTLKPHPAIPGGHSTGKDKIKHVRKSCTSSSIKIIGSTQHPDMQPQDEY